MVCARIVVKEVTGGGFKIYVVSRSLRDMLKVG